MQSAGLRRGSHFHMSNQICAARDSVAFKKKDLNTLIADYYCVNSFWRRHSSYNSDEAEPQWRLSTKVSRFFTSVDVSTRRNKTIVAYCDYVLLILVLVYFQNYRWVLGQLLQIFVFHYCPALQNLSYFNFVFSMIGSKQHFIIPFFFPASFLFKSRILNSELF